MHRSILSYIQISRVKNRKRNAELLYDIKRRFGRNGGHGVIPKPELPYHIF